jgi:trehalose 6-phosphate phosphatase
MKPIPDLSEAALLLDLDGTLIDIAPTPDSVVVPPGLTDDLRTLRRLCGDALAVVTGRPIAQVDKLLGDAPFAVAGEHGAMFRHGPGLALVTPDLPSAPPSWIARAEALAARHPGAAIERKRHGFVLHYRAVPDLADMFQRALKALLTERPKDFVLLPAKMAWEIRPAGIDKGRAVAALMASSPFAGRIPIFIGDDVTDEDGIAEAERRGGAGLLVGRDFADAAEVRAWVGSKARGAAPGPGWRQCLQTSMK